MSGLARPPHLNHWGLNGSLGHSDPSHGIGNDLEKEAAFVTAFKQRKTFISLFPDLPTDRLDALAVSSRVAEIGRTTDISPAGGGER